MSDTDRRKLQLEASLDASGVREGAAEAVAAARTMAAGVEAAGRQGAAGLAPLEAKAGTAAASMSRAERSMVQSVQRATAAMQSGGKAGSDYYEMLAKQRGISGDVLKPYITQLREAEAAQRRLNQTAGMSDKATSAAMRGVPAQFTDIMVSLQGGQSPLTVALQQGGQLKDMFGGAGNAAKALGGYVLGLVNPFTLAGAAAGVLGVAYYQGTKEADAYGKSIIMTGNAAGTSVGQLAEMAQALDGKGFTEGAAAAALAEVASTGRVAAGSIQLVSEAALRTEREAGVAIGNTVKEFVELGKSPVEASLKLTETHRYLTAEIYQQIKALADQGREADAARLAQETYANALMERTGQMQERLGLLQRAWRGIKDGAKEAWDAMLNIGREKTLEDQLAAAQQALDAKLADSPGVMERGTHAAHVKRLQDAVYRLQGGILERDTSAWSQAESQRVQQAGIKAADEVAKANEKALSKQEQMNKALREYRGNLDDIRQADPNSALLDPTQIAKSEAAIREQFKAKNTGGSTVKAERRLDLTEIQRTARDELASIDQQQRAIDLRRQAGLIAEQDYYDQKRALIVNANETEGAALREQISRLEQEKVKGKDALEVQKQLVEARSKLKIKEMEGQNKLAGVNQEAEMATRRQDAALQGLTSTHTRYLLQLDQQAARTVGTAWMGDKQRQRAEGQWAIEDRYLGEQRRLEDQRMFTPNLTPEAQAQINTRLQQLHTEKARELQIYQQTYQQLDQLQSQWQLGAGQAMQNYADQTANVAWQVGNAFSRAFQGMEDSLVNFAMTGKLNFKSLAESIIGDLIRIQIRASMTQMMGGTGSGLMGMLTSAAGAMFGGWTAAGVQASGAVTSGVSGWGSVSGATLPGLSSGGYTGDGGKYDPAGIVHRGEYVINAASTRKLGLGYLNSLNGYANGGLVGGGSAATPVGSLKVEIINSGQPMQVERTEVGRGNEGQLVLKAFLKEAVSQSVKTVAAQTAGNYGDMGQAFQSRKSMGM